MIHIAHWAKQAPYAHYKWQFPKFRYNLIRELDFGKFSVFIGKVNTKHTGWNSDDKM